jgi:hypothetical protein
VPPFDLPADRGVTYENVAGPAQEAWPRILSCSTGAHHHDFATAALTDRISRRARSIEEQLTTLADSDAPGTKLAAILQE